MPKLRFTSIGLKHQNHHQPLRDQDTKCHGSQTSYPSMQSPNHGPGKLDMLSQHAKCKQVIPACIWPIKSQEVRHAIPACSSLDKLSQHAVGQSKARKARHTIPACSGSQSQQGKARHAIPAYSWPIKSQES